MDDHSTYQGNLGSRKVPTRSLFLRSFGHQRTGQLLGEKFLDTPFVRICDFVTESTRHWRRIEREVEG